mgnify:CR=1 FL=1
MAGNTATDHSDVTRRVREVLQGDVQTLRLVSYRLTEDAGSGHVSLLARLERTTGQRTTGQHTTSQHTATPEPGEPVCVEAEAETLADALFTGLVARLVGEHPSLATLRLSHEQVTHSRSTQPPAHQAQARVGVRNAYGAELLFTASAPSAGLALLSATLDAVDHFINAEVAYTRIWQALHHARRQHRTDLEKTYTELLAELVRTTSYADVISRLQGGQGSTRP